MSYINISCPSKQLTEKNIKKLLNNKKKMFDLTFPTPESLNKYYDDNKINQKILNDEEINKQNKNLSEMVDKNLNKYFNVKNNAPFVVDMLNLGNNSTDLINRINFIYPHTSTSSYNI